MSTTAIFQAAISILQAALAAAGYSVTVEGAPPKTVATPTGKWRVYMFHHGSTDEDFAGPVVANREHIMPIRVMRFLAANDAEQAELDIAAIHDVISDAYKGKRTLNGTCNAATLGQYEDPRGASTEAYLREGLTEYRQRWYTLHAIEQKTYPTPTE
jgi:hypothetical protein